VSSKEDSKAIDADNHPAIIISASGMCEAGRIKHHLKHNLWRKECMVLFVGFQAEGTLGRSILSGEKRVKIHGEEIAVEAEIRDIAGFSAHADQPGLLSWLKNMNKAVPRKVFLVHGEPLAIAELQGKVTSELGLSVAAPEMGEEYDLAKIRPESVKFIDILPAEHILRAEVSDAFEIIRRQVNMIGKKQGQNRKTLEMLLAKIKDVESELKKLH